MYNVPASAYLDLWSNSISVDINIHSTKQTNKKHMIIQLLYVYMLYNMLEEEAGY